MLRLSLKDLRDAEKWEKSGFELPRFDFETVARNTRERPAWLHFGTGNIFRGYVARLQQDLLNEGRTNTGILAAEAFDPEIIDRIYIPYDNLSLAVVMDPAGNFRKIVVASIAEGLHGTPENRADWERLREIMTMPSLQMVSFTITEKGYGLTALSGGYLPEVRRDMESGPGEPRNMMAKAAALAYRRYSAGRLPIAFLSLDNCAHNGEKLENAVKTIARAWVEKGLAGAEFLDYLNDRETVTFPWSMIDKITPRPSEKVGKYLSGLGFADTEIICTAKRTYIAPFVNTEETEYLVIEDRFPNGRPPLERAGVIFTDRETVEKTERMKVTACLNPLHTTLAVYGCLLGYHTIAEEMRDPQLKKLVERVGYAEGMPVVTDPGIIRPEEFIRTVIEKRLPNPYIPDTPQRIATDTSQKLAIRFGETIRAYCEHPELDVRSLTFIPLVLAGWLRYLLAVDDSGEAIEISADPMLGQLRGAMEGIVFGRPETADGKLKELLSNRRLFGVDLNEVGLGGKIENDFREMISGPGAVRKTLVQYLR